jgi:hypothetical protein
LGRAAARSKRFHLPSPAIPDPRRRVTRPAIRPRSSRRFTRTSKRPRRDSS